MQESAAIAFCASDPANAACCPPGSAEWRCVDSQAFAHTTTASKARKRRTGFTRLSRCRRTATTAINTKSGKDLAITIAKTWALRNIDGLSTEIIQRICDNVFVSFSVLLYAIVHDVKKATDRKEILMHLKKVAPDLRFSNGLKQKIVYFLYRFIPITFIETRVLLTRIAQKKQ